MEIMTLGPKYVEFLMNEGQRGHIDMGNFTECVVRKDVGITADIETGAAE